MPKQKSASSQIESPESSESSGQKVVKPSESAARLSFKVEAKSKSDEELIAMMFEKMNKEGMYGTPYIIRDDKTAEIRLD